MLAKVLLVIENVLNDLLQIEIHTLVHRVTTDFSHNPCTVNTIGFKKFVCKSIYRIRINEVHFFISIRGIVEKASWACSTILAGTITIAPASASSRVISSPNPKYPPVTMAIFPLEFFPPRASLTVVLGPKPEIRGADWEGRCGFFYV